MTGFRYIGITDECIECQCCGKQNLRSTVVLAILDADGNMEDYTYYGSTCAAKALSIKGGGRAVLSSARAAHDRTLRAAKDAREMLEFYGLPLEGEPSPEALRVARGRYVSAHRHAMWARNETAESWMERVMDMLARKRAEIAEAAVLCR